MPSVSGSKIEYALPNSRVGFFNECLIQKFEDTDHINYETSDYLRDTYDIKLMRMSGECVSFCVGGPRFFGNATIVETFEHWSGWNRSTKPKDDAIYKDCKYVGGSSSYRAQPYLHLHPTNTRLLDSGPLQPHQDEDDSLFKDPVMWGYVASQLSHLPRNICYEPGNILSHRLPIYFVDNRLKDLINARSVYEIFFP